MPQPVPRVLAAALLLLALPLAGCLGGPSGGDEGLSPAAQDGQAPVALPRAMVNGTWVAQANGTFEVPANTTFLLDAEQSHDPDGTITDLRWDMGDSTTSDQARVTHRYAEPGVNRITLTVTDEDGLTASAPMTARVIPEGQEPASPSQPDGSQANGTTQAPQGPTVPCGDGQIGPGGPTGGSGDDAIGSLAWAATKTGSRLVVAWQTPTPATGNLTYRIGNGSWHTVTEATPGTTHVMVLEGISQGELVCFRAGHTGPQGSAISEHHGVVMANAMTAYDPGSGSYTLNLLVLANEQQLTLPTVEAGIDRSAELVWDGTDGHVRMGQVILLHGTYRDHNSGWASCYIASLGTTLPSCHHVYDVIFSHDSPPGGAAATYKDGIQDPEQAIWMSGIFETPPWAGPSWGHSEVGPVLTHEIGHYVFGAQDLYSTAGTGPDCWDPETEISIMGSNRGATELDDAATRCPNEDVLDGYVPSWTLLRERFEEVPERPQGPASGPEGTGGLYGLSTLSLTSG